MTYGALRLRLSKLAPGTDLELLDGWIQDRYTEILDQLPWKRQENESVLQVPASYITGTITAVQGSNAITGVGTTWSSAMNGLMIRIANQTEYYQFTDVNTVSATLDRNYEAPSAAALAYRIDQPVFLLPANARYVTQVRPLHNRAKPLTLVSPNELNRIAPWRSTYGTPKYAAATWDNFSDPPQLQLELYPIPDCPDTSGSLLSYGFDYVYDAGALAPDGTSVSLLPFVRAACLIAGVQADIAALKGDAAGIQLYAGRFTRLLAQMTAINTLQRGPSKLRLAPGLLRQVPNRYRRGPIHRGYTG